MLKYLRRNNNKNIRRKPHAHTRFTYLLWLCVYINLVMNNSHNVNIDLLYEYRKIFLNTLNFIYIIASMKGRRNYRRS